jgi:hypothetical protein
MIASDEFSQYYAELLQGTYDCVDRIVLNAFYPLGQTGGGVRSWWRRLYGDDSNLDDEHLREMAGTFSRRLHAFCAKQGIPIIEAQARDRKHELAQPYEPNDPKFCGLFFVIKSNIEELWRRASVPVAALYGIAKANGYGSLGTVAAAIRMGHKGASR